LLGEKRQDKEITHGKIVMEEIYVRQMEMEPSAEMGV
jgi:hypothetical protein